MEWLSLADRAARHNSILTEVGVKLAADLQRYAGREQSFIKHRFLTQYLQAAAYKVMQGRSTVFNFVDAFAGPWRVSDEFGNSDASFDQALRTLDRVRADLGKGGLAGLKIRFCFCEKRGQAVKELRRYAAENSTFDIHVFHGSFEDHLNAIASACRDGFTFTFIDPTGWNIRSEPIFEFLRDQKGEFLINFMADDVNRHAGYNKVSESFGRFLAAPEWEADFDLLPADWGNEERVLYLLKRKIRQVGAATYLPDFPIMKPREERVKMRLLLGTHSSKGLEVFRDVQGRVERTEIETRNQLRNSDQETGSLFTDSEIAALQQNAAGVGCPKYQREAKERMIELLAGRSSLSFGQIAIDVMENVPIRLTQMKALATELRVQGVVAFDLPARKRLPQPDTPIRLNT